MFDLEYSVTSWGSPKSPKRALLLHGLMGTGAVFFKVAEILIKNGYRVDAPDLLGHGWAPHSSERYTIPLIASHLASHIQEESYDVIAGVSFGSTVILSLLPHLTYPPKRVVLVEPILDMPAPGQEAIEGMVKSCNDPPSEEGLMKSNLKWIKEEAVLKRLAFMQMDSRAIEDLFDEIRQGNLSHSLIPPESSLPSSELIILSADPEVKSVYPTANADKLAKDYPHVKYGWRKGATHDMHKDKPEVVAGVIMDGLTGNEGVEVLRV